MSTINSILSGLVDPLAGYGRPMPDNAASQGENARAKGGDVFVRGEWWANGAAAKREGSAPMGWPESGQRTPYPVRVYNRQQQNGGRAAQGVEAEASEVAAAGIDAAAGETELPAADEKRSTGPRKTEKQNGKALSEEEMQEVALLQKIDAKVRAHEMAHLSVAGEYAQAGASFQYKRGPDGQNYAVGGEVSIDVSKGPSPQATIGKMQTVKAAALAPADPSPQDRKVAAAAGAVMSEARQELRLEKIARFAARQEQKAAAAPANSERQEVSSADAPKGLPAQPAGAEGRGTRLLIDNYFKAERAGIAKAGFATVV